MSTKKTPQRRIKLEIAPDVESGTYCNAATVIHGETEFIIDLGIALPGKETIKILSRIITSPKHAKQLHMALKDNLTRYEARFGTIDAAAPRPPAASGGGGEPVN